MAPTKINAQLRAAARKELEAAQLDRYVRECVAKAPPLTDDQKECIAAILLGGLAGGATKVARREAPPKLEGLELTVWTRQPISETLRTQILDSGPCYYCGTKGPDQLDHVFPWARGGTDDAENLVPSCGPCNGAKGKMTPDEWRAKREANGDPWPPPSRQT